MLPPYKVALLVLPHASMLTVASTLDPLRCANRHLGHEAFRWIVVSPGVTAVPLTCGLSLPCQPDLSAAEGADLLLVIAGFRIGEVATRPLIQSLLQVAPAIPVIGAIDSGSWILAKAGLLDGYRVTTHWEDLQNLAEAYPALNIVPDRYVISGNRISAGGAAPAFDMMIHLIRQRHGAQLAHKVASSFITTTVDPGRPQQRPSYQGTEVDPRLASAIAIMETSLEVPLTTAQVAERVGLSVRRMEELFRRQLGLTPGAFGLELRLQAARRMLTDTRQSVAEVALKSGFSSPSAFSRAFSRRFGETAQRFRGRVAGYAGNGMAERLG